MSVSYDALDLNLREKLAELTGLKQRVSPDLVRCDFTNLVTNGTFDTDTDWTKGANWTIGSGVATKAAGGLNETLFQNQTHIKDGRYYSITVTLSGRTAGGVSVVFTNSALGAVIAADGTYTRQGYDSGVNEAVLFLPSPLFDGDLDNVSLYEADPSDDAPWLRLPFGYKVGTSGRVVRDGLILHPSDYTEITDSGQTFIKPLVAPSVSTQFSIWAGA